MSKLNLQVFLNSYSDDVSSNNPSLNNFRWFRDLQALAVERPASLSFSLAPGESRTLFDGTRTLLQDGTTQYQLALKSGQTWVLKHVGGTAPQFRSARTTGADATTQVSVTKNGSVLTFASTGGTLLDLIVGGVTVGDEAIIGDQFAAGNRGKFKVLARTATSFSVENSSGVAEGPITLGSGFADQIRIYSAAGVQVGDKLRIFGGFSAVSQNSYEITGVQDNLVEFYWTSALPTETVTTQSIAIYSAAKRIIYLEADGKSIVTANSVAQTLEKLVNDGKSVPGIFLKIDTIWSLTVQNNSTEIVQYFLADAE